MGTKHKPFMKAKSWRMA